MTCGGSMSPPMFINQRWRTTTFPWMMCGLFLSSKMVGCDSTGQCEVFLRFSRLKIHSSSIFFCLFQMPALMSQVLLKVMAAIIAMKTASARTLKGHTHVNVCLGSREMTLIVWISMNAKLKLALKTQIVRIVKDHLRVPVVMGTKVMDPDTQFVTMLMNAAMAHTTVQEFRLVTILPDRLLACAILDISGMDHTLMMWMSVNQERMAVMYTRSARVVLGGSSVNVSLGI